MRTVNTGDQYTQIMVNAIETHQLYILTQYAVDCGLKPILRIGVENLKMRVTIEPTNFSPNSNMRTVIESYSDDLDLHTVMTDLIAPALIGWGFHPGSVYEYIEQDYSDKKNDDVTDAYNYLVKPLENENSSFSNQNISVDMLDKNNWGLEEWKE